MIKRGVGLGACIVCLPACMSICLSGWLAKVVCCAGGVRLREMPVTVRVFMIARACDVFKIRACV